MTDLPLINGLWIGTQLSPIEQLTIRSFQDHGHSFCLWVYEEVKSVPEHTIVRDAGEIIPAGEVFRYRHRNKYGHGKGSYAGFSDIFRYKLLRDQGGVYVDMDITCLRAFDLASEYVFRYHHKFGSVGNVMKCPQGAEVMDWCYHQASERVGPENRRWELPIEILNEGIRSFGLESCIRDISNMDRWPVVAGFVTGMPELREEWMVLHWMNEEWRRLRLPKDSFLSGSRLHFLMEEHGVSAGVLSGWPALSAHIRAGRAYYMAESLRSKFRHLLAG